MKFKFTSPPETHLRQEQRKMKHPFKISHSWSCIVSFEYMLENMRFIFSLKGEHGRPYIVLKEPIETMDTFEITYCSDGLDTNGCMRFNDYMGEQIENSSLDAISFIKEYLIKERAFEFPKDCKVWL